MIIGAPDVNAICWVYPETHFDYWKLRQSERSLTCHSASMGSAFRGALVEPGSLGFMPKTFRLQLYSSPDSSDGSLDHSLSLQQRLLDCLLPLLCVSLLFKGRSAHPAFTHLCPVKYRGPSAQRSCTCGFPVSPQLGRPTLVRDRHTASTTLRAHSRPRQVDCFEPAPDLSQRKEIAVSSYPYNNCFLFANADNSGAK